MCPCCVTGDEQDGVEPKPHPMYENMQISAVLQPHLADKDADSSSTDAGEFITGAVLIRGCRVCVLDEYGCFCDEKEIAADCFCCLPYGAVQW